MNKQELIEKYKELWNEHSPFDEPVPYISMVELFLKELKQLDEPQKVTIPQFVADWIEEARKTCKNVADFFDFDFTNEEVGKWFMQEQPFDLVARAWLDGYEVEEERRYLVRIKGVEEDNAFLNYYAPKNEWFMDSSCDMKDIRAFHTRKELENAGFSEVFNSPLFEVQEVE